MKNIKKIGIIDVFIIIFVTIVSFLLIKEQIFKKDELNNMVPIVYRFEIEGAQRQLIEQLELDKEIFIAEQNTSIGKVKDFQIIAYEKEHEDLDTGELKIIRYSDKYTALLDIKANSSIKDDTILVGQQEIKVGSKLRIKGKAMTCTGYITHIEKED